MSALKELGHFLGRLPAIHETLQFLDIQFDQLLKHGLWSRLLADAGLATAVNDPDEHYLARGVWRLSLIEDTTFIHAILREIHSPTDMSIATALDQQLQTMLHVTLWGYDDSGRVTQWCVATAANESGIPARHPDRTGIPAEPRTYQADAV